MKKSIDSNFFIERSTATFPAPDLSFKIILVGDSGTGKTSLAKRVSTNDFDDAYSVTIGGDFVNISYVINKLKVKVQLWDTCGLEQYRSLVKLYFKGAHAALIAYDMSQERSFTSVPAWCKDIRDNTSRLNSVYLIGTKVDLGKAAVPRERVEETVQSLGLAAAFETSAKTREGVDALMKAVLTTLYRAAMEEAKAEEQPGPSKRIGSFQFKPKKKGGCC